MGAPYFLFLRFFNGAIYTASLVTDAVHFVATLYVCVLGRASVVNIPKENISIINLIIAERICHDNNLWVTILLDGSADCSLWVSWCSSWANAGGRDGQSLRVGQALGSVRWGGRSYGRWKSDGRSHGRSKGRTVECSDGPYSPPLLPTTSSLLHTHPQSPSRHSTTFLLFPSPAPARSFNTPPLTPPITLKRPLEPLPKHHCSLLEPACDCFENTRQLWFFTASSSKSGLLLQTKDYHESVFIQQRTIYCLMFTFSLSGTHNLLPNKTCMNMSQTFRMFFLLALSLFVSLFVDVFTLFAHFMCCRHVSWPFHRFVDTCCIILQCALRHVF